jgi:RHS repeat-associated protein
MAQETVTQSKRFYCVSLLPDICKTPVGNSTPPLPYTIIGEFKDATGVSKNVKAQSEPLFLHDKSKIPTVKGDAAGSANGIKSGTVGKEVTSKESSSTKGSNGTSTLQVFRKFLMNKGNTIGQALKRTPEALRQALKPYSQQIGEAAESLKSGGEAAMSAGGDMLTTAAVMEGAAGVSALTGVGLPVAAVVAPAGVVVGGVGAVTTAGGGLATTAGNGLSLVKDFIDTGAMPDVAGALVDTGISIGGNVIAKKIPGVHGLVEKWQKKRADAKAKRDGGKVEQKKDEKKDKPSDCCPKGTGPGGVPSSSRRPVHFGTGEEILRQTDFVLDGPHPFAWTRCYRSGSEAEDWGLLGARWATPFTSSLSVCAQGTVYHEDTGRALRLPVLAVGQVHDHHSEGFTLQRDSDSQFTLTWRDGSTDTFVRGPDGVLPHGYQGCNAMLAPRAPTATQRYLLARSTARDGKFTAIEHYYDAQPGEVLLRIRHVDGQVIEAVRDAQAETQTTTQDGVATPARIASRIGRVEEAHPDGSRTCHASYTYATEPVETVSQTQADTAPAALPRTPAQEAFAALPQRYNLVTQANLLGEQRSYSYQHHLLVQYTNYSGFADGLTWVSLAALRERWSQSNAVKGLTQDQLGARHPITLATSYQARATRNTTSDGNGEVQIDYISDGITHVTDALGGVMEHTFNSQWLCTKVRRLFADGKKPLSFGTRRWSQDGQLLADVDAQDNATVYTYDAAGNLASITDAKQRTTHIQYNPQNLPIAVTDALGHTTQRRFDSAGRILQSTDALGHSTHYQYDAAGRLATLTDAKGGAKQLEYDQAGRLVAYTDCSQFTSRYQYDQAGRITATEDAVGNTSQYQYDALGRVTRITHPNKTTESHRYDSEGNLLEHTDAQGQTTRYTYNGHGLPIQRVDAKGQSLHYHYDKALRLVQLVNANHEAYTFSYDPEGRLLSETGFDGKATQYQYDTAGQLIASECNGQKTQCIRDDLGQLQAKITDPSPEQAASGSAPDITQSITRYAYDALDRLTAVASPQAQQHFGYDAVGQLIEERIAYALTPPADSASQAPALTTAFQLTHSYDPLGNRLQTTLPNGRTIDTQRYGSGHWHGTLWQGSTVVDLERDHLHRETVRQLGSGTASQSSSNGLYNGQSAPQSNQRLTSTRSYDPQSRLAAITLAKGAGTGSQRLRQRSYQYDQAGNLAQIEDSQRGATQYRYDPLGQLMSAVQPSLSETFAFDPAGNLLDQNLQDAQRQANATADARLDQLTEQPAPGSQVPRNLPKVKLAQVTHNLLRQYLGNSYEYDIQGNTVLKRLSVTLSQAPSLLPAQNQAAQNQAAQIAFAYDADNRLVQATRTWEKAGSQTAQIARYSYDAFGRRIAKQVTEGGKTETTLFVWDGDVLVQEIHPNNTITYLYEPGSFVPLARVESKDGMASYVQGEDLHLPKQAQWGMPKDRHAADAHLASYHDYQAVLKEQAHQAAWQSKLDTAKTNAQNDTILHYQCDHLGTPLELMDETGKVVWAARYKAWGRVLRYDKREVEQPLRFQGQYEDAETGLFYNRYRYYDPDQARYITQDPIKLAGGYNVYSYGLNPSMWVDPLGLTGVYIFETLNGNAYVGKGPYSRYQASTLERTRFDGSFRASGGDIDKAVARGAHSDVKSPCSNVSTDDYALMVESEAMRLYALLPGSKPTLNRIASPGEKKLETASQGVKCPGLQVSAASDAMALIGKMKASTGR